MRCSAVATRANCHSGVSGAALDREKSTFTTCWLSRSRSRRTTKALSQNNFSELTLLLYYPMLECFVQCARMHGILGRGNRDAAMRQRLPFKRSVS